MWLNFPKMYLVPGGACFAFSFHMFNSILKFHKRPQRGRFGSWKGWNEGTWWYIHACCQDILVSDLSLVIFPQTVFSSRFKLLPSLIVCGDLVLIAYICFFPLRWSPPILYWHPRQCILVTEEEMERVCKFVKIIQFAKTLLVRLKFF